MSQDTTPETSAAGGDMPARDPAVQATLDELRGGAPPAPPIAAHAAPPAPFQPTPYAPPPAAPPVSFGVPFRAGQGGGIANITATLEGPGGVPVRMDQLPPAAFPFQPQPQAHPFAGQIQHVAAQPMPGRPGRGMQMQMSISGGEASAPPALPAFASTPGQFSPEEEHWRQRLGIARLESLVLAVYAENEALRTMILSGRRGG